MTSSQARPAIRTFQGVPGEMIGAVNFDANKENELLYKVDDAKLFAACGAGVKTTTQIVAAPLAIEYAEHLIIAGHVDINKDGKADIVTVDIGGRTDDPATAYDEAKGGAVKVYLSSGKATPAPELTPFDVAGGTETTPAPSDSGDGGDGGTATSNDGGDGGDAGTPEGTATPDDADDDGDDEVPGDDEGSGTKNKPTKKPTSKKTPNTGSATVSIIPKPQTADDGCSAAPGSHGTSSSAAFGVLAGLTLLVRRRRNQK